MRSPRRLLRALAVNAAIGVAITGIVLSVGATPAAATPSAASLTQQIDQQSKALEKIIEQYDGVNQQLSDNQAAESKLQQQIAPELAATQAAQQQISALATQAYMAGPFTTATTLVNADSAGQVLDAMTAMNEVARARDQVVAMYQSDVTAYNTSKQKLDGLITIETAQKQSLTAQKKTINTKLTQLYALRKKAYGSATATAPKTEPAPPYIAGQAGKIVDFAYAQLGKPYVYAAAGPSSYDCSGLVLAAYKTIGISLPHNTVQQWGVAHHIARSALEPGDVVFYEPGDIHHVAIYIGNGQVIHAPTPGDVVKISSMDMMKIYGYGRFT